jgi:carbonic anhydrase
MSAWCTLHTFDPAANPFVPKEFATLRVNVPIGSSVSINHVVYDLVQFHFHSPSEHTVRGRHAPMEVHFVHLKRGACIGDRDALLVVGARIVAGREHRELDKIFRLELPADATHAALAVAQFDLNRVLPRFDRSWQYAGSLTAPSNVGCNNPAGSVGQQLESEVFPENVSWVVLTPELQMSKRQIRKFQALFDFEGNSRLPQPTDGRTVFRDQRHGAGHP